MTNERRPRADERRPRREPLPRLLEHTANFRALDRAPPKAGHHTPILWPPRIVPWQDWPRRGRARVAA